jgi:hypothetical protein
VCTSLAGDLLHSGLHNAKKGISQAAKAAGAAGGCKYIVLPGALFDRELGLRAANGKAHAPSDSELYSSAHFCTSVKEGVLVRVVCIQRKCIAVALL